MCLSHLIFKQKVSENKVSTKAMAAKEELCCSDLMLHLNKSVFYAAFLLAHIMRKNECTDIKHHLSPRWRAGVAALNKLNYQEQNSCSPDGVNVHGNSVSSSPRAERRSDRVNRSCGYRRRRLLTHSLCRTPVVFLLRLLLTHPNHLGEKHQWDIPENCR